MTRSGMLGPFPYRSTVTAGLAGIAPFVLQPRRTVPDYPVALARYRTFRPITGRIDRQAGAGRHGGPSLRRHSVLIALVLLLGLLAPVAAAAQAIPDLTLPPDGSIDLVRQAVHFDGMPAGAADAGFPPEIRSAAAETAPQPPPWPDYTVRWLAVRLHNPAGSGTTQWMLRMDCDPLYLPQVTVLQDGHIVSVSRRQDARAVGTEAGGELAVGQRFPLTIPPGESRVVLLRVMALGFGSLVADILPRADWVAWASGRQAVIGFGLAMMAAISLYTLLIGFGLRSTAYLLYVVHSVTLLVFWSNYYGLLADLAGYTDHSRIVYKVSATAATAIAPLMARAMLDVPRFSPWLGRILLGLGLVGLALLLPTALLAPWPGLQRAWLRGPDWQYLLALGVHSTILVAAVMALRRSVAVAGFFLAGWSVYIAGTLGGLAAFYGLLPFSGSTLLTTFLGASWEALLLALALTSRLRRLQREKIEADTQRRAHQDFLAMIGHDLRMPLNAILAATGMLADGALPEAVRRRLDTIRRAGRILQALVSDLVDRASLSSGTLTVSHRAVPLSDCIREAVELLRDRIEEKRLQLHLNIDPELPPWIVSDELRIKQILFNLLDNAVRFTASGTVAVTAAKGRGRDGDRLLVSVRDSGPGIAAADLADVFRRYRRGGSEAPADNSFGLGLAIARDLARAMDGDIEVESAPGEGSCFYLSLPLQAANPADPPLTGLLVLLVDGAPADRETESMLLRRDGHLVRSSTAAEALALIEQSGHDAVLLNLDGGGEAGLALVRRIRALPRDDLANMPVIAIAAAAEDGLRHELAALGVFDLLLRPLTSTALHGALARAVDPGPHKVNYAMQNRAVAAVGAGNWSVAIEQFRAASRELLQEIGSAAAAQRADLLHRLGGMASAVGLDALAAMAAELERRQRLGISVSDELAALQTLWQGSLERSRG